MKSTYPNIYLLLLALPFASLCGADDSIPIPLQDQSRNKSVQLIEEAEDYIFQITAEENVRGSISLFEIENPEVTGEAFAVQGEVRYRGVVPSGYLEMWTHLPAEKGGKEIANSFFSRTMSESGSLKKLSGDEDWRSFQLPAIINDGSERKPLKLSLNVTIPETGVVEIRNLRLIPSLPVPLSASSTTGNPAIVSVFTTITILGISAVIGFLLFFLKKKKTRDELSRIRNLDSI